MRANGAYHRPQYEILLSRLREPRRFIQILAGPRQVGKTTLARQVGESLGASVHYASADEPTIKGRAWLMQQWETARVLARVAGMSGAVLILDEVQKLPGWAETVKALWDADTASGLPLRVVLLGSSPLLIQRGVTESLAGRFELLRLSHWSYPEMRAAYDWDVDSYVFYGGYPGAAPLIGEPARWRAYVTDSLVETSIARDILLMTRVDKPALLRQLFELGCSYSGQVVSFTKLLGQLQDAGNTTTLAHYLELLEGAGMLAGLQKYAGQVLRRRGSSPKFQVLNTALLAVRDHRTLADVRADASVWGRFVESAVGAHLVNGAKSAGFSVHYWREGDKEVDFVLEREGRLVAIEVKSACLTGVAKGMEAFVHAFNPFRILLVGEGGVPLETFLSQPAEGWFD